MKSCILGFSLWLITSISLFGQLTGQVLDENNQPLAFANVLLLTASDTTLVRGTITDDDGYFNVAITESGTFLAAAEALGYKRRYSSSFSLLADAVHTLPIFTLATNALALEEVTVKARKPLFEQTLDRLVVNVQQSPTNAGATALEVLERSPGINIDRVNQRITLNGRGGVAIMINNRLERMDQTSVLQLLAGMPAANIDRIELISVPPANFDAEGDGGIIHIVLLSQEEEGWHGQFSTNTGYAVRGKWGTNANIYWRKNRWNGFANIGSNNNYTQQNTRINRSNLWQGTIVQNKLNSDRPAYIGFHNIKIGADYKWRPNTLLGLQLAAHRSEWTLDARTTASVVRDNTVEEETALESYELNNWNHAMTSAFVEQQFGEGRELTITMDYLYYFDDNPTDYRNRVSRVGEPSVLEQFRSRKETPVNFWVMAIDYHQQVSERWNWQAGAKLSTSRFENKTQLDRLSDERWLADDAFTDVFSLDEDIYAAYWTGDAKFNEAWQFKFGGRYEYLDSRRVSERDGQLPGQKYGRVFPSVYLTYQPDDQRQWGIAYTERITRPSFNVLAPAFFFFGPNTILAGNPAVRQILTRQLKIDYRYRTVNVSLQLSDDNDPIAWGQPLIDPTTNLAVIKADNMSDQKMAMLSLNFPLTISDWWTSRWQASGHWIRVEPIFEGNIIVNKDTYFRANASQQFTINETLNAELSTRINSPFIYALGQVPWRGAVDVALQKSFQGGQHRLSLNWSDIFKTSNFWAIRIEDAASGFVYDWRYALEGAIFRLSYTYQFGSKSDKVGRERRSASAEEQGRVN